MPFIEKPEGLSAATLELLDAALTKLWLEQVAIGAALRGAPAPDANAAPAHKSPQERQGFDRRAAESERVPTSSENPMPPHKYKAGQDVYFNPPKGAVLGSSQRYRILRLLPVEGGEVRYRIKSAAEEFERVARESELARAQ